ncbi:MAG: HlyC/CorC family transporter, partial [Pseudomonadota bacterium]
MDTGLWITAGAIIALLLASGFFSGSETALTAVSRGKLRARTDKGDRAAERALRLTDDSERFIGSILLGNNLVNILATALATMFFTRLFGEGGVFAATVVMTALVVIFAEVLPKTYAITNSETAATRVAPVIQVVVTLFAPVVSLVQVIVRAVLRAVGVPVDSGTNVLQVKEEIEGALSLGHSEGAVEKEHRDRLLGALDLGERVVEEIMLHRSQIQMIDADISAQDMVEFALKSPHTRLPIFKDDPENIIGVIHAKDLLRAIYALPEGEDPFHGFDIMSVAMKPYFVPETTTLDDQMREFLRRHTHFALVVDEYGALQGLLTLEDILEEIVGEITDEFDSTAEHHVRRTDAGDYLVDGAMTIRDLNRANDWSLPDEEANTIAGLVIHEAQMIPSQGQVFSFHGFRFEVLARKDNRITRLKIRKLPR